MEKKGGKSIRDVVKAAAQEGTRKAVYDLMKGPVEVLSHPLGEHVFQPPLETKQWAREQLTACLQELHPDWNPQQLETGIVTAISEARKEYGPGL